MAELLRKERQGQVLILTLNRPEAMNCFNFELLAELGYALKNLNFDPELRAVIVTGAAGKGKPAFSAGADLAERKTMSENDVRRFIHMINSIFTELENLELPTLAAINGFAFGGGLELALACDLRIASSSAVMGLTETSLAVTPGAGGTQRLPRLIGVSRAKEMIFAARRVTAAEALASGLVNHVVEPGELMTKSLALAGQIARNGPIAVRQAKFAINRGMSVSLEEGLRIESNAYDHTIPTEDRREGLQAFAEKREPIYKGK